MRSVSSWSISGWLRQHRGDLRRERRQRQPAVLAAEQVAQHDRRGRQFLITRISAQRAPFRSAVLKWAASLRLCQSAKVGSGASVRKAPTIGNSRARAASPSAIAWTPRRGRP